MGQARLRAKEIADLKAQGPKPKPQAPAKPVITAFGAYYHDDQPDGIGIWLSVDSEPSPGWTNLTFYTLAHLVSQEFAETTPKTRQQRIDLAWEQLHENRLRYNRLVFGTETRQVMDTPMNTTLTDELIEVFVNVISSIWYLEKCGEIPNDDHNGSIFYADKPLVTT
jgi:hypothetical protein